MLRRPRLPVQDPRLGWHQRALVIVLIFPPPGRGQGLAAIVPFTLPGDRHGCVPTGRSFLGASSPTLRAAVLGSQPGHKARAANRVEDILTVLQGSGTPGGSWQGSPRESFVVQRLRAGCSCGVGRWYNKAQAPVPLCIHTWPLRNLFLRICQGGFHKWTWETV